MVSSRYVRMFGYTLAFTMVIGPWAVTRGARSPRVTPANWYWAPYNRWSWQHTRRVFPTANISRGAGPVVPLPSAHRDLSEITFMDPVSHKQITVHEMLAKTNTDGFIVLQNGKVVDEQYFHGMMPASHHIVMSVTKSVVGSLAGILVAQGKINPDALVVDYLPQLKDTVYGKATVREVLNMTVSTKIDEANCPPAGYCDDQAAGWVPPGPNAAPGLHAYLLTMKQKNGPDGKNFLYLDPNPLVITWIMETVDNEDFSQILQEDIWSKLGTAHDAYVLLDHYQEAYTTPGLNTTLTDLARFGEMMLNDGYYNGQQIVPRKWAEEIMHGGEGAGKASSTGWNTWPSYQDFWWRSKSSCGRYAGIGLGGQLLMLDPVAHMVVAKFTSDPSARSDGASFQTADAGINAIIQKLSGHGCQGASPD